MPDWVRPIVAFLQPLTGPRGLEFARTRLEIKAIETVLQIIVVLLQVFELFGDVGQLRQRDTGHGPAFDMLAQRILDGGGFAGQSFGVFVGGVAKILDEAFYDFFRG